MAGTMVAIDVGASRTRVRVGGREAGFGRHQDPLIREVRSVEALHALLAEVRAGIETPGPVYLSGGIAGPQAGEGVRVITNWSGSRTVSPVVLRELGFDAVLLMNDLEAAAHGLVALLEDGPDPGELVAFGTDGVPPAGNRTLVIPGSGLGSAGIIDLGPDGPRRWHIVASEAGHAVAGGVEDDPLLQALSVRKGRPPTWEECVSGPGLEALWLAGGPDGDDPISAPEIAALAALWNPRARSAVQHYYLLAARFAQVLSLAFLSTGGLYLAGGTTRSNAPLIPEETFLEAFRRNPRMEGVLRQIPVFLVLAEINLLGAWVEGWRRLGV